MPPVTKNAFDDLVVQSGLPLSEDQKAALFAVYPTLLGLIERVTAPMPREAEPSLIFVPEIGT